MYAYFVGDITYFGDDYVFLETKNGVAYRIFTPQRVIEELVMRPENRRLYTYTAVREDAMLLYGFLETGDVEFFRDLITVNGIGPKGAVSILSNMEADTVKACILTDDISSLSKVPGIGKKTAERMVLDLKDKLMKAESIDLLIAKNGLAKTDSVKKTKTDNPVLNEASDALMALGFSKAETMAMLSHLEITEDMDAGEVISTALQYK